MNQCDEVRPVCRPCLKARLACAYELPPGQTRAQAMIESQQRLREELHSHTSLIQALRCTDANSSVQMLNRLRHGDYDSALLGTDAAGSHSQETRIFPWEERTSLPSTPSCDRETRQSIRPQPRTTTNVRSTLPRSSRIPNHTRRHDPSKHAPLRLENARLPTAGPAVPATRQSHLPASGPITPIPSIQRSQPI
jgi:hypothetical protein